MQSLSRLPKGTPHWVKFGERFKTWKSIVHYKWDLIIVDYVPGVTYANTNTRSMPMIDIVFITTHKGYRLTPNFCIEPQHVYKCLSEEDVKHEISLTATLLDRIKFWDIDSAIVTRCKTVPDVIDLMKRFIVLESL